MSITELVPVLRSVIPGAVDESLTNYSADSVSMASQIASHLPFVRLNTNTSRPGSVNSFPARVYEEGRCRSQRETAAQEMALVDEQNTGELRFDSMINPNGGDFTKNNPLPESMQPGDEQTLPGTQSRFQNTSERVSHMATDVWMQTKQRAGTARERTEFFLHELNCPPLRKTYARRS